MILTSGFLGHKEFVKLCDVSPMAIPHQVKMIIKLRNYDFTWIRDEDPK
jgi:hypothetical protein